MSFIEKAKPRSYPSAHEESDGGPVRREVLLEAGEARGSVRKAFSAGAPAAGALTRLKGMAFSCKKEGNSVICDNLGEPGGHCTK